MRIASIDYPANVPGSKKLSEGGPGIFAKNFSAYVAEQGHTWIGILQRNASSERVSVRKMCTNQGREYVGFYLNPERRKRFFNLKREIDPRVYFEAEIKRLTRFLKSQQIDVVFLNGYSIFGWMLLQAAWRDRIPLVIQYAGILTVEVTLYKHLYSKAAREMLIEMERDTARYATRQVFLNEYSREVFQERVTFLEMTRTQIIPLPYSETAEHLQMSSPVSVERTRPIRIGCVARWDRIKNHKAILALAQEIRRQKLPWQIESVTTVPPTNRFRAFKKAYQKHIQVTARMSPKDLRDFYRKVDILILPSIFDVSPTVVMEAAHEGKLTLISPQVGWVTEYTANGLESCIVDFSNPANVVKRLMHSLLHTDIRPFQAYIERYHAPQLVFQTYIRLFNQLYEHANRSASIKLPANLA